MTDDTPTPGGILEDPPSPSLDELQQREVFAYEPVKVCIDGPTQVQRIPNRRFSVSTEPIGNATAARILTNDFTRARAVILLRSATATDSFTVQSAATGQGVDWPANVPLIMEHCDEVFAKAVTPTSAVLSVMVENYAD